jgi:hypothetical protein
MIKEQNFLVRYGLHNFVTYTLERGKHVFSIKGTEGMNMIKHAQTLIEGSFGQSASIRVAYIYNNLFNEIDTTRARSVGRGPQDMVGHAISRM